MSIISFRLLKSVLLCSRLRVRFPFCSRVINRPVHLNSSAKVASLLKMPQTNKFKSAAASSAAQSAGPDREEPLRDPNAPPGDSGGDDNQGDHQMIKSPSDPKQYRYTSPHVQMLSSDN